MFPSQSWPLFPLLSCAGLGTSPEPASPARDFQCLCEAGFFQTASSSPTPSLCPVGTQSKMGVSAKDRLAAGALTGAGNAGGACKSLRS